jgi:Concanavalin A-like lectin/glucanases superfamily
MSAYSSLALASSPRAYYRMSDLSGSVAHDSSGNGYNGTIVGNVSLLQQNAIITDYSDYAMLFTANTGGIGGGYITSPSGLKTDGLAALTVECWVYLASNAYTYFPFLIANDSNPSSSHVGFRLSLTPASSNTAAEFLVGNGTTGVDRTVSAAVLSAGGWHHIVGVYDGAAVWAYLDGIPSASTAMTGTVGTATHNVGIAVQPSLAANNLSGTLDEIAIYPSALSAATILSHYTTGNFGRSGITPFPSAIRRTGTFTLNRRQS